MKRLTIHLKTDCMVISKRVSSRCMLHVGDVTIKYRKLINWVITNDGKCDTETLRCIGTVCLVLNTEENKQNLGHIILFILRKVKMQVVLKYPKKDEFQVSLILV